MPKRDGTGPRGQGAGRGQKRGMDMASDSCVRSGAGFSGYCICPNCGLKISHTPAQPCSKETCPECWSRMMRE
ncbi:MAG TPA: hypothetical protein VFG29_09990 [Syntrophales bacterium]|nr:hypothetical protein [Syntrophales bacterium]